MADRTPLYAWHREAGARFIEFGGWELPLQYSGIVGEHLAVRSVAGIFDVSHMGKLFVEGPGARPFLDGLSANDVPTLPGRAAYTHLLREDGTILDDVIVTCLSTDRFFLVCNAGPRADVLAWLVRQRPADIAVRDVTCEFLCLALQGPRALELLGRFTAANLEAMKAFTAAVIDFAPPALRTARGPVRPVEIQGWGSSRPQASPMRPVGGAPEPSVSDGTAAFLASRTGYTGEPGFELFPPQGIGRWVWESLLAEGADIGLRPVGLGARDTLRLEKGYLLSGQDFDGRQTPLEVNCAWIVKRGRPFLGREALEAQRAEGAYRRLVGLRMADRGIPRHGCAVLESSDVVGTVTSGTLSPSLRVGIALASVEPRVRAAGTRLAVDVRGVAHPALVVPLPFL